MAHAGKRQKRERKREKMYVVPHIFRRRWPTDKMKIKKEVHRCDGGFSNYSNFFFISFSSFVYIRIVHIAAGCRWLFVHPKN